MLLALGAEDVPYVRGDTYKRMRCPFHFPDRTPSGRVNERGFTCHACGRSGDAIKLLREEEGLTLADAIQRATEITGFTDREVPAAGWAGGILSFD